MSFDAKAELQMDNWQKLGAITARVTDRLTPIGFSIILPGPVAAAVKKEAAKGGRSPEVIITEAVRAYLGDAA